MRRKTCILPLLIVACSAFAESARVGPSPSAYDPMWAIVDGLASRWARYEGEYVEILAADPSMVSEAKLAQLFDFVALTLDRLDIDEAIRRGLSEHPIRYLLCSRREDIRLFTGVDAAGVALLRQRIIVTHYFPHEHELVHLLAGLVSEDDSEWPPKLVSNEVILQEGLAGYLGGRRSMSSLALRQSAEYQMLRLPVDPTRFFEPVASTMRALHDDLFYAGATRFVEFLIEEWGMKRFLALYRLLACTQEEAQRRPTEFVLLQMEAHYQLPWSEIRRHFHRWRRDSRPRGPELCERPQRSADFALALDARRVEVWERGDEWVLHVEAVEGYPEVWLYYGERLDLRELQGRSTAPGNDRRYLLRLQPDRVELHDLAQERLLTQGQLPHPDGDAALEPPRSFTVRVPREQMRGFGNRNELSIWTTPRLEWPPIEIKNASED